MSTPLTGTATYPTSFQIPSDGDGPDIKAADVNVGFEALADRTEWLKSKVAPSILVARKAVTGGGLSIAVGGTTTANASVFSTGITTQVGDELEIHLVGTGALKYGADVGNFNGLVVQLSASENGGGFTTVVNTEFMSCARNLTAGNGSYTKGPIALLGFRTVATAGTLVVRVEIGFSGAGNSGDLGDLVSFRAVLNQYRSS